jgi:hypothetical protein
LLTRKQVSISLSADGSAFRYTVTYGRLPLLPRKILPFEAGEVRVTAVEERDI